MSTAVDVAPATRLDHLQWLEAEAIYILREVVAECRSPVLLYSIGKDSSILLHLAAKAFYPGRIPFPVLPQSAEIMNIVIPNMMQNALTKKMTVAEATDDAAKKIKDLLGDL